MCMRLLFSILTLAIVNTQISNHPLGDKLILYKLTCKLYVLFFGKFSR